MARKKRQFLDDDDDSDSPPASDVDDFDENDPDLREERALFENPYKRAKRRKGDRKDDAVYGVFGDDSDEDTGVNKRSDWTKAPAFVSQQKVEPEQSMDVDQETDADQGAAEEESDSSQQSDESDMVEQPKRGLGLGASKGSGFSRGGIGSSHKDNGKENDDEQRTSAFSGFSRGGIGSSHRDDTNEDDGEPKTSTFSGFSRGGIGSSHRDDANEDDGEQRTSAFSGFSRGGIGSFKSGPTSSTISDSLPTAFGANRVQRSFVRTDSESPGSSQSATPKLSASERVHFSKLQGTFGAKMLAKMGWVAGTGLGTSGEGRVAPVETKLRKKGMGLAFGGFRERTEQEKAEARRRGEVVTDDEVEGGRGKAAKVKKPSDAWKRPKKVKTKVEHKTYEEIIAEAGGEAPAPSIGQIIDATGATLREVTSLADISSSSWTPTSDSTRIPEVRHNLRLVVDSSKGDLDGLAREARALEERKKWIRQEDARLRMKIDDEAKLIARLQQVHLVVDDISTQAKQLASSYEASLEQFGPAFDKLLGQFPEEFERYRLDEIVVAAIAPSIRRMLATWKPLEEPNALIPTFQLWRRAFKITSTELNSETSVQPYGSVTRIFPASTVQQMSPFESLLWHAWLPKVRSAINNDWLPEDPSPAIRLYEAWSTFLPPFVRDNFFDQLVLPKVHKAVADWNPKKQSVPLHTLILPWLPHIGLREDEVLEEARRKVKSLMRGWNPANGLSKEVLVWKDVFDSSEWEDLLLKYVVPKLGAVLREDFQINPANQDMQPLNLVLSWSTVLRPHIFSQLVESQFFPKWLRTLHQWLVHPKASFEEIAQWYSFWKGVFPINVQQMTGVERGFSKGLQLINKALELGPEASTRLPPPELEDRALRDTNAAAAASIKRPSRTQEITFRSIVEDFVASHNLLFIPAGRVEEKSRMPLFRISKTADGKGGLLVYILDDAVWALDGDEYRAIGLEEVVLRANKR